MRLAIIRPLALGIGMMQVNHEAFACAVSSPLQHLQIAIGIARGENGALALLRSEPWLHTNYGFKQRSGAQLSREANSFKQLLPEEDLVLQRREKYLRERYKLD